MKSEYRVKRRSLRDIVWDYPLWLSALYMGSRPLPYILFGLLLGLIFFNAFTNVDIVKKLYTSEDRVYSEGVIGTVTSFNPLYLTQNPVDKDVHELVYDKLLYIDRNGDPQPGLAIEWEAGTDMTSYIFTLDSNRYWHDGQEITAEDVVYTIDKAKDLVDKGPDTVGTTLGNVSAKKVDTYTVEIVLEEPSAVLMEALSIYILPEHVMRDVKDSNFYEYGSAIPPVGSGPYKITAVQPTVIELSAFDMYPSKANIPSMEYHIYPDLDTLQVAFMNNKLDVVSHLDDQQLLFAEKYDRYTISQAPMLQRRKLIFFNTRNEPLNNFEVRGAISHIIDKEKLVEVTSVTATPIFSPISRYSWAYNDASDFYSFDPSKSEFLFANAGYVRNEDEEWVDGDSNPLVFTLTYLENVGNESVAQYLRDQFSQYGVDLRLRPKAYNSLANEVLATRDFEMLLFELETSVDPDQYNLWHSSKKDYPDLNIAGYEYGRVDVLLEEARVSGSREDREEKYKLVQRYMGIDTPVVFLYEPYFNILVRDVVSGINLENMVFPHDRFRSIGEWEIK